MGVEFSGSIVQLGPGVGSGSWEIGNEVLGLAGGVSVPNKLEMLSSTVIGQGAYAEYIAVPQTHILPKPGNLSWSEAASIPEALLTGNLPLYQAVLQHLKSIVAAYQAMIKYGEIKSGENVLVHAAASGVGIAAIQLARANGASVGR
jgi:NADPH:quinone reductase-like Zn-dependent oxidoreductase